MRDEKTLASDAAAALGRIKTPKKAASSAKNLEKARRMVKPENRIEKARKGAMAANAKLTPAERSERARNAVLARWKKKENKQ